MFDPLLEELHISITEHGGNIIRLPDDFRERSSLKDNAKIQNWLWDVPGFRRWRVTRLDGGKTLQVLNSVAYPQFNGDQPILGIDLLWFGLNKKLVAVLDFQPLTQEKAYFDKYFEGLQIIKSRFPEFNNQKKMVSYDPGKYFSPWVLFCKGDIKDANITLPIVFTSFLNCYWDLITKVQKDSFSLALNEIEDLHIQYDKYSAERDPAHGLFISFFGKEWSDRFIKEFLFPFSNR